MNTPTHCACRTAALRIFVLSLVGPVPTTISTRTSVSRTPTTARQWRSLSTTSRSALSRFKTMTPSRTFHVSRRLLNNAQPVNVEQVEATAIGTEGSALPNTRTIVSETAIKNKVAPTVSTSPPSEIVLPLPAVVQEAEIQHLKLASTAPPTDTQVPTMPGKNRRKKLRRQQEAERLAAEAAAAVAAAAEGKEDIAEAQRLVKKLKPKKEKKEPKEKKNKLQLIMEARDAKKKAKKDKRRERRAAEKAAAAAAASAPKVKAAASAEKSKGDKTKDDKAKGDEPKTEKLKAKAKSDPTSSSKKAAPLPKDAEPWQIQKRALREKFPEGWNPKKKLSPDALEGIRALNRQFPQVYTTAALAGHFQVSPEAIRRILKSKWQAKPEEEEDRQERWFQRGKQVWTRWAELGRKPPKRWQAEGILREPMSWPGGRRRMMERLGQIEPQPSPQKKPPPVMPPSMSRQKQIERQNKQNRQNFRESLSAETVFNKDSIPSAEAMQRAIEGNSDTEAPAPQSDAPSRSVELTPHQKVTLRKATRSLSMGRAIRLQRRGTADKKETVEEGREEQE